MIATDKALFYFAFLVVPQIPLVVSATRLKSESLEKITNLNIVFAALPPLAVWLLTYNLFLPRRFPVIACIYLLVFVTIYGDAVGVSFTANPDAWPEDVFLTACYLLTPAFAMILGWRRAKRKAAQNREASAPIGAEKKT